MFTGIIEEVGAVARRSGSDLAIVAERILEGLCHGESVAIDGACMTVVDTTDTTFVVQVSPESFKRTTLGGLKPGDAVNLERAMAPSGRFGGHFVLGHVDGVGEIEGVEPQGDFSLWRFKAPAEVSRYLVPKGSVTVDGISLTVVEPAGDTFSVAVVPTTLEKTTLGTKGAGSAVNLEADVIGKHIFHYMKTAGTGSITAETLSRHGFV